MRAWPMNACKIQHFIKVTSTQESSHKSKVNLQQALLAVNLLWLVA